MFPNPALSFQVKKSTLTLRE